MQFRPHRYRTEFPTVLSTPLGKVKVVVNDVNESGALITVKEPLSRGHKVELVVLNQRVTGVVQWAFRGKCGITFRPNLSIAQVDLLRYKQGGKSRTNFRPLGFAEMR